MATELDLEIIKWLYDEYTTPLGAQTQADGEAKAREAAADSARIGGALADIRGVLVHLAKSKAISSTIPQDYVVFTDGAKVRFEGVPTQLDLAAFVVAFVKTSKWLHVIPLGVIISEIVSDLEKLTTEATAA